MLDPRIYRMSLVVAALALVVLGFSLTDQSGAEHASLSPTAFNGANVTQTIRRLQSEDPSRPAGSDGDASLARTVAGSLRSNGFAPSADSVSTDVFAARTAHGERELQNVVATRAGSDSNAGSIVIVAPRDASGAENAAALSPTATLLELGRALAGETLTRTVVLASTSGTEGAAGAARLARELPRPVDAVVVLGDLASRVRHQPIVVPWASTAQTAPPALRNTIAAALRSQAAVSTSSPGVLDQLAHLAFPLTISGQGPFGAAGLPAVEVSLSGERGPRNGGATVGSGRLTALGRSVLAGVSALEGGGAVAAPSAYVLVDGKVVPSWAMSLFVLALIVPVALTTIDGVARARRRRRLGLRSLLAVLSAAGPFLAALLVVLIGRAAGLLPWTPGPSTPGAVPVTGGAVAILGLALLAAAVAGVGTWLAFRAAGSASERDAAGGRSRASRTTSLVDRRGDGPAAALLLVLCVVTLLIWLANPFAAALLVPALHLWLWAVDSDLELPVPARLAMLAAGLIPIAGLVVFYGRSLHFGPGQLGWEAVLLLSGHVVSIVAAIEWCVVLGCLVSGVALVLTAARRPALAAAPVTVRGPVGYAGPGSLGGTKSALRR